MKYSHLAEMIFGAPLLVEPVKLDTVLRAIGDRFDLEMGPFDLAPATPAERKPYEVQNGVAIINVMGSLMQRSLGLQALSGLTSYAQLASELDTALADTEVNSILFRIDSSGGAAAGAFDLADKIAAARKTKKIVAIAEDKALSAAYLIACAASEVYLTQSGAVGSIGVVLAHVDTSKQDALEGRKVTLVHAGERKTDGDPSKPLVGAALAAIQARVDQTYELFTSKVASLRAMKIETVKAQEANVFQGDLAITNGLADGVCSFETLLTTMSGIARNKTSTISSYAEMRAEINSASSGMVPALSNPAPSGKQEVRMADTKKPGEAGEGEVVDLASFKARLDALEMENKKLRAKAELDAVAMSARDKEAVILKHQDRGALSPAMLTAVNKLAEVMTAVELDAALAAYPAHPALAKTTTPPNAGKDTAITDADPSKLTLDPAAQRLADRIGFSQKSMELYANTKRIRLTEEGPVLEMKDGSRKLLKDLNAGRA